jgi:dolichol-phosphate mannosyltransferase
MQINVPLHRVVLSKGINLLVRKLFRLPLRDATSGFRCFRAEVLKRLHYVSKDNMIESNSFTASLELLLKTVRLGGIVSEIPILLDYGRKGGASKMRVFSTILSYLALLFKYRNLNNSKRSG